MNVESKPGRAALATGIPVAIVVALHGAIGTAIIAVIDVDVRDPVASWLAVVLGPSLVWAVLVIARAAAWRRHSTFWLGASAGIVVLLAFLCSFGLLLLGISSAQSGAPLAILLSSWLLLACALTVSIGLRLTVVRADAPGAARGDGRDELHPEGLGIVEAEGSAAGPGSAPARPEPA